MYLIVIRTFILYFLVIFALRVMGKRQIGDLQPSELVVTIMISDLAAIPMHSLSEPLVHGILPILTLLIAEVFVSLIVLKSESARAFISGRPSIIIYKGKLSQKELKKSRLNIDDLIEELRIKDCPSISDVEYAILETTGKLSIILKSDKVSVTRKDLNIKTSYKNMPMSLVSDGNLQVNNIKTLGFNEQYVENQLKKNNIDNIKDVFIAGVDEDGNFFYQLKENKT